MYKMKSSILSYADAIVGALAAGGYRQGEFPQDYELWLRLHQRGHKMHKLSAAVATLASPCAIALSTAGRYSRRASDHLRAPNLAAELQARNIAEVVVLGRRTRQRVRLLAHGIRVGAFIDIDPR